MSFAAEYRERVFEHFLDGASRRPHAEPRRALQPRDQVRRRASTTRGGSAPSGSPPATTRASSTAQRRPAALLRGVDARQGPELLPARGVGRRRFARALFPLGELHKTEVRALARELGARRCSTRATAPASASSASGRLREFLAHYLPAQPGADRDAEGARHRHASRPHVLHARPAPGLAHRRRARRGAKRPGTSPPRICERNELVVVQGHDHPLLIERCDSRTQAVHWIAGRRPRPELPLHRQGSLSPARSALRATRARRRRAAKCDFDRRSAR